MALAVAAIVGVTGLPALTRLSDRSRASGGAHVVASVLCDARQRACATDIPHGVLFLRRPDRMVEWEDRNHDGLPDVSELLGGPILLPSGCGFGRPSGLDPITFVGDKVLFTTMGGSYGINGGAYLMSGSSLSCVTVLTNGRIAVKRLTRP